MAIVVRRGDTKNQPTGQESMLLVASELSELSAVAEELSNSVTPETEEHILSVFWATANHIRIISARLTTLQRILKR